MPKGNQNDNQWQYLYGSRWRKASKIFLKYNPLCKYCLQLGITTPATVTDHIKPHKGNIELFWDVKNWQPLCKQCHDSVKAIEEARGYQIGCGTNGTPVDPNHEWNKGEGGSNPQEMADR